jgi:small-conductance mechanosensitive channel
MSEPLAGLPSLSSPLGQDLVYVAVGLFVLFAFVIAARVIAHAVTAQLRRREVQSDLVVLGRRVAYVLIIGFGILAALGFATQTANVALLGILLATIVAALGLQQLLQDYVSGYYVLLERHIRVGDRIGFDDKVGTVSDVNLRVTLIHTDSGDLIVVPNSELFNKPVTVFTKKVTEAAASPAPPE